MIPLRFPYLVSFQAKFICMTAVNRYITAAVELPEVDVAESFQLCIAPFFLSDCSALVVCAWLTKHCDWPVYAIPYFPLY